MQENRWFVMSQGQIRGPFDQAGADTEARVQPNSLVWGRGQADWLPIEKWNKAVVEQKSQALKEQPVERMWRVRIGDEELKPLNYDQMIASLKDRPSYQDVWIWTEGYSEWRDVYQIHKIMDELGVGRRAHPRVPIVGQVACEGASGPFQGRALSISEGGLGMTDAPPIKIGEKFKIILKSPNLFTPLHVTAEVVFVGADGYAGLRFIGLQTESKSSIIEYVKKFQESHPVSKG